MCGVTGIVNLNGDLVSADILQKMTDAVRHRGPDGEGFWLEGNVGLGHRRLSIIDLSSAGHQPMTSDGGRYSLSYNGEIYNYRELRAELKNSGFVFRSNSDTEVVLYALIHWGTEALLRFNGMFAIAFWDTKERSLLLARDRFGIKPLYYSRQGSVLAFGSEQKAILAHPEFQRKIDASALMEYFTFQNILSDRTLIEDIRILPAGHYAILKNGDTDLKMYSYWDFNFREPNNGKDKEAYIEELNYLFQQSINRQLVSDVELGAYLSGGMDSGSITAITAKSLPNLKSFTCGFDLSSASGIELVFDERIKAEAMSAKFKTEHYEMVLKAGDMERCLPMVAKHLEEPRVGQSYPNYYAAQLASKFVKVVLSGTGGDELFGGYPWRYYHIAGSKSFDDFIDDYYNYWQRLVDNNSLKKIFSPIQEQTMHTSTYDIFRNVFVNRDKSSNNPEDYVNHCLYFESKTFLHGLFVVEDKLSMAHSLESRVPFMDNDLVEFAMQCPVNLKLNNLNKMLSNNQNNKKDSFRKTNDGKQIMREVMKRYIPEDITSAQKQGFSSPDASWFKGESIDFVKRSLLDKDARIYDYLDHQSVTPLIEEHLAGKENRRLLIWSLLNVDAWMKDVDL